MYLSNWKRIFITLLFCWLYNSLDSQVTADFNISETEACGSLQVNFYDQSLVSSGSIVSWEWDLGGDKAFNQNPGKIFTDAGEYTICLTVTDNSGNTDQICKENIIKIYELPKADFTFNKSEGCAPLDIDIKDLSSTVNGEIVKWIWDLGGSANVLETTDALEDISTTFDVAGLYSMSLTIEDEKGCINTIQKKDIIDVSEGTILDIDYEILTSCSFPWRVQFNNLSPDPEVKYVWDFGNGDTFDGAFPPEVEYNQQGLWDVTLITFTGECTDTTVFEDYIDTDRNNDFSVSTDTICAGNPITFTDESTSFADSVRWNFGDGNFSSASIASHTFDSEGCYPVTLIRYRPDCNDTIAGECLTVLPKANVSYTIDNQFACGVPTEVGLQASSSSSGTFSWHITGNKYDENFSGENINVIIEKFGKYDVTLDYIDTSGCTLSIDTIEMDVVKYSADLPKEGPSGCIPLNAVLADSVASPVPIMSWEWMVLEENNVIHTSTDPSPSFTFPDIGRWDVQLIVENIYGCRDTVYRSDYIKAGEKPEVDFIATPLESCISDTKQFLDQSDDSVNGWLWIFGDNTNSMKQNPAKRYANAGTYDVTLIAFHNGCGSSEAKTEYISILEPRSAFKINYNCDDPYTVDIENRTIGADSVSWTIFSSPLDSVVMTDSLIAPFTFPDRGDYVVKHYAYNDSTGCEHIKIDTARIRIPKAQFVLDTLAGCAPLKITGTDQSQDAEKYLFTGEGTIIKRDTFPDPTFTYKISGTYSSPYLRVTDIHGCQDSVMIGDSIYVNQLNAAAIFDNIVCVPGDFFPESNSSSTFSNITSYNWSINDTLYKSNEEYPEFTLEEPGLYDLEITVRDDWNCKATETYPTSIDAVMLDPDFTADPLSCTWAPVRFRAKNAGTEVDSFLWDFGDGNFSSRKNINYTYQNEGVYSVCLTMIDRRGCEQTVCKDSIVTIANPIAEFSGDPLSANCPPLLSNFQNLSENATEFLWDFGDNTGNSTNEFPGHVYTDPGSYDVTLIASMSNACADTLTKFSYVNLEGPIASFSMEADSTCTPLEVMLTASSDDYYLYVWDYGNGQLDSLDQLSIEDTTMIIYTEIGRYIPKIIIIDTIGCSRTFAGEPVFVNSIDVGFTLSDSSFCNIPADVQLNNITTSSSDEISYEWIISGPQNITSKDTSPMIRMDSLGLYDIALVARAENCIDTFTMPRSVEVTSDPIADFEILDNQLCEAIDVQFQNRSTVDGGLITDYFWDFGDGDTSTLENPSHQYAVIDSFTTKLTVTTRNGCIDSFTMMVPVLPSTIGYAGEDDTICMDDEIRLVAEVTNLHEGSTYYWEADNSLSCINCLEPLAIPDSTRTYIFTAVHPNGCESIDSVTITVIQEDGPQLELSGDTSICMGEEAIFTVDNFDPDYTYLWNNNTSLLDCIVDCDTVRATPNDTTDFYITIFNEYGCFTKDTLTVYVETALGADIIIEDKIICQGNATTLGVDNGVVLYWDEGVNMTCTDCENPEVSPDTTSKYYVTVASEEGCPFRDSILIEVIPPEAIDAGQDTLLCLGEEVMLRGQGMGNPEWYIDTTMVYNDGYDFEVGPADTTAYILQTTIGECIQQDTVQVNIITKAEISSIGDTICFGEEAIISAVPGIADRFWWENVSDERIVNEMDLTVTPDSSLNYRLIGAFRICEDDTSEVYVHVFDEIKATIPATFEAFSNDKPEINVGYDDTKNYSFEWTPGEGLDCTNCPNPVLTDIMESTRYQLTVTDEDSGCQLIQDVYVRYSAECTDAVFYIPNIFTPNQDGNNDKFIIGTRTEQDFRSMQIFDRWGNRIFYTEDITQGWDGSLRGSRVLPGVYVFQITAFCPETGENFHIMGDVTLMR